MNEIFTLIWEWAQERIAKAISEGWEQLQNFLNIFSKLLNELLPRIVEWLSQKT